MMRAGMGPLMLAAALLAACGAGTDAGAADVTPATAAAPTADTATASRSDTTPVSGRPAEARAPERAAPGAGPGRRDSGDPMTASSTDSAAGASTTTDAPADTTPTPGDEQEAAVAALGAVSRTYEAVNSLRADFTQTLRNPLLGTERTSRGTLYQRQPDRFLLRFTEPAGDVILADGRYFWVYYPSVDEQQVIRSSASEPGRSGIDLRSQFIGDPLQRFQVQDLGPATVRGRTTRVLTLRPRDAAGYRSLKVWIDDGDHLVRTFEIEGEQGVVRHFELTNVVLNPSLPDSLFQFTPPPDARIVDRGR